MAEAHELILGKRSGLPDTLAYLRPKFPSVYWRSHPNYGALADFWRRIHDGLRREGADLQTLTRGFGLWVAKAVLNGEGNKVIDLARTALLR